MLASLLEGGSVVLEVQGSAAGVVFGVDVSERLRRQLAGKNIQARGMKLVVDSSCVMSDVAVQWLLNHPRVLVSSPAGTPLAVVVRQDEAINIQNLSNHDKLQRYDLSLASDNDLTQIFNRKLRRRQDGVVLSINEQAVQSIERTIFNDIYKGITDIVTLYVWPTPAFWAVRYFSRIGVSANMVTTVSIVLIVVTAFCFLRGLFVSGIAAGWLMTFLDTVDGKLARATVTSSKFGDRLDHIPDILHPPIWWGCFAYGLVLVYDSQWVATSCVVVLLTYLIGRVCETAFKRRYGFNQYLWKPFDKILRMIIARRNVILFILTIGLVTNNVVTAFYFAALWSLITIAVQLTRLFQANSASKNGSLISSWIQ